MARRELIAAAVAVSSKIILLRNRGKIRGTATDDA
jgi:hypothetical protein